MAVVLLKMYGENKLLNLEAVLRLEKRRIIKEGTKLRTNLGLEIPQCPNKFFAFMSCPKKLVHNTYIILETRDFNTYVSRHRL